MKRYQFLTNTYLAVCAIAIGILTGLYLNTINYVIDLIWRKLPDWLNLPGHWQVAITCLLFSVIIGLSQKYLGPYPVTIAEIIDEVHINGHFAYQHWRKILFSGLLILGAGGSIGPEASASGLVAGMVYWFGCRYKILTDQATKYASQPVGKQIKAIISTRITADNHQKKMPDYFASKRRKQLFYWGWTLVGIVGMFGYFHFFPQEGVIGFHHPLIHWQWQGLAVVIPAVVIGWAFGYFFVKVGQWSNRLISPDWPIMKAIAGGILLVLGASFSRDILFSGEFSIVPFAHHSLAMSPLFLITFAIIKTVVTNFGFSLGWRGGTIFPAIFSSLAIGAALAQLFPWMPRLTACIVVATAITVILERPLISALILILLLPIQFSLFIILICWFTSWGLKHYHFLHP